MIKSRVQVPPIGDIQAPRLEAPPKSPPCSACDGLGHSQPHAQQHTWSQLNFRIIFAYFSSQQPSRIAVTHGFPILFLLTLYPTKFFLARASCQVTITIKTSSPHKVGSPATTNTQSPTALRKSSHGLPTQVSSLGSSGPNHPTLKFPLSLPPLLTIISPPFFHLLMYFQILTAANTFTFKFQVVQLPGG